MDYEKAYKAVLKTATQWIKDGCTDKEKICLECVFPELRESEDERTRKRAIAILKQQRDYWSYDGPMNKFPPATPRKDLVDAIDVALAYLEKQKESLHISETCKENADSFTDEDERIRKIITDSVFYQYGAGVEYKDVLDYLDKLEKQKEPENTSASTMVPSCWEVEQKEQKPYGQRDECKDCQANYAGSCKGTCEMKQKEQKPTDDKAFEEWLDDWYQGSKGISGYVVMNEAEFKNWSRGIKNMYQQKLDIALIQRSWYMEGYHDREFGKEPMWIIKTGESGPKHELNPKYGQLLDDEQKPAEWSEEDEYRIRQIERIAQEAGCTQKLQKEIHDWLKSLRPSWKPSEQDELMKLKYAGTSTKLD